tara:strand:+ start:1122 stop:1511 length:390 start_codon:yes stop_codon:yes gene_type:complete
MTINQLFKQKPSLEVVIELLNLYGIESLDDDKQFNRNNLINLCLIDNLNIFKSKLIEYYLPCKRKVYLEDLTIKKSITILRQILKLYDYVVKSNERWIKGEKIIVYQILPKNSLKKPINSNDKCIISFD